MSALVRTYPALALLVLAMLFGVAPLVAVNAGLLPAGADQLGRSAPAWRGSSSRRWKGERVAFGNCSAAA